MASGPRGAPSWSSTRRSTARASSSSAGRARRWCSTPRSSNPAPSSTRTPRRRTSGRSLFSWDLLANAVVSGLLLGGFYGAVSLGIALIFGLLDIANISQPAFVILGSYAAYVLNAAYGLDPILTGLLLTPVFYALGALVYRVYYASFERRGDEALRGLVFFFGLLFIMEVSLSLTFGVDYRLVQTRYTSTTIEVAGVGVAFRYLVPCVIGVAMTVAIYLFLGRTFHGRAIMAVSQD